MKTRITVLTGCSAMQIKHWGAGDAVIDTNVEIKT